MQEIGNQTITFFIHMNKYLGISIRVVLYMLMATI